MWITAVVDVVVSRAMSGCLGAVKPRRSRSETRALPTVAPDLQRESKHHPDLLYRIHPTAAVLRSGRRRLA